MVPGDALQDARQRLDLDGAVQGDYFVMFAIDLRPHGRRYPTILCPRQQREVLPEQASKKQADRTLFENCRRFIPEELRLLSPDIIVTQGGPAKDAILKGFDVQQHDVRTVNGAHYETGFIALEPETKRALWLHRVNPKAS